MKTDIEYAALVMADSMPRTELHKGVGLWIPSYGYYWNPLGDDGDSRRLENACFRWMAEHEGKHDELPKRVVSERSHLAGVRDYGTDEAVRATVLALAVAIGKIKEGNDNAG
jgi:hypothetical protein